MTPFPIQLPRAARLVEIRPENYRTKTFVLDVSIDAAPGQFAMLWLPGLDEKPFSLLDDNPLSFTIAAVGPFTRALHTLAVGDRLWWRGPFGHGFDLAPSAGDLLMVGGGYGVAPLLFLANRAVARGDAVRMVIGARTAEDVLLAEPFRESGAEVVVTTEDATLGIGGRVTAVLPSLLAARRPDALYACGPHGMLASLEQWASDESVPAQLSWEAYMRCGIGICGSCEHRGRLLCADGPVLVAG